ncbi:hypothetical protein IAR50_000866 [Cryptococcus sp. DSM 104548]
MADYIPTTDRRFHQPPSRSSPSTFVQPYISFPKSENSRGAYPYPPSSHQADPSAHGGSFKLDGGQYPSTNVWTAQVPPHGRAQTYETSTINRTQISNPSKLFGPSQATYTFGLKAPSQRKTEEAVFWDMSSAVNPGKSHGDIYQDWLNSQATDAKHVLNTHAKTAENLTSDVKYKSKITDKSFSAAFSATSKLRERVSTYDDPQLTVAYNNLSVSLKNLDSDISSERAAREDLTAAHSRAAAASYKGWRLTRAGLDVERNVLSLDDARSYGKQYSNDLSSSRATLRQQAPWEELLQSVNSQSTANIVRQAHKSINPDDDTTASRAPQRARLQRRNSSIPYSVPFSTNRPTSKATPTSSSRRLSFFKRMFRAGSSRG